MTPIKLAAAAGDFPKTTLPDLFRKSAALGYTGMQLGRSHLPSSAEASAGLRRTCTDAGMTIACVDEPMVWTPSRAAAAGLADHVRHTIDAAAAVGCPLVKKLLAHPACSATVSAATEFRDWLASLADHARAAGVRLLVQNQGAFTSPRQVWTVLDQLPRAAFGCCWDSRLAQAKHDAPAISVPMLNHRIALVQVSAPRLAPLTPGSDEWNIRQLLHRLRGIGYAGFYCVHFAAASTDTAADAAPMDSALTAAAAPMDSALTAAAATLRSWAELAPSKPTAAMAAPGHKKTPVVKTGAS